MKLPLYQVDAFTDRVFGGNPAAVVLLDEWLPDRVLAAIAAENNLAETAFVVPRGDVIPLRWFTPKVEVDLCGHATLAAAHVLFRHKLPSATSLTFSTLSGNLVVRTDDEIRANTCIRLTRPATRPSRRPRAADRRQRAVVPSPDRA